jgi:AcrR family transcriptional regulator
VKRKESRSVATQARIISTAQRIFARDGFAKASLAEIVSQAEVTTGAVYHHFGDKKGLLRAVAEHLEEEILLELAKLVPQKDPWVAFETGVLATLEICARPDIQRIVFQEAPNVIGPAAWREIEVQYAFGVMQKTIRSLAEARQIQAPDPDLTAQIILGAVIQAAHGVAISKSKQQALADAKSTITLIIRALRTG